MILLKLHTSLSTFDFSFRQFHFTFTAWWDINCFVVDLRIHRVNSLHRVSLIVLFASVVMWKVRMRFALLVDVPVDFFLNFYQMFLLLIFINRKYMVYKWTREYSQACFGSYSLYEIFGVNNMHQLIWVGWREHFGCDCSPCALAQWLVSIRVSKSFLQWAFISIIVIAFEGWQADC